MSAMRAMAARLRVEASKRKGKALAQWRQKFRILDKDQSWEPGPLVGESKREQDKGAEEGEEGEEEEQKEQEEERQKLQQEVVVEEDRRKTVRARRDKENRRQRRGKAEPRLLRRKGGTQLGLPLSPVPEHVAKVYVQSFHQAEQARKTFVDALSQSETAGEREREVAIASLIEELGL